jgi:hypothetical protein
MHDTHHPLTGATVTLTITTVVPAHETAPVIQELQGKEFRIEDWQDRVFGKSWMVGNGNPACIKYAIRSAFCGLPLDDEVVYGKIGSIGHIVHVSEFEADTK